MNSGRGNGGLPTWLRRLLRWTLPREDRVLLVEIDELHSARRARAGRVRAGVWALRTVFGFAARLGLAGARTWFGDARADLRQVGRTFRRRPAWALTTVATLGVGVASVISVYAIADWVLLRPVPGVRAPDELVELRLGTNLSPRPSWAISHADLMALRAGVGSLGSLEARVPLDVNLSFDDGPPLRAPAAVVTAGWFDALGVELALGRAPVGGDPRAAGLSAGAAEGASAAEGAGTTDGASVAPTYEVEAVVSWSLARSMAPRVADVLGRTMKVNGRATRIVGVAPQEFRGVELSAPTDLWLPATALPAIEPGVSASVFEGPGAIWPRMVGRPRPGVSAAQVASDANRVMEELRTTGASYTFSATHFEFQAVSGLGLDPGLRPEVGRTLRLLAAASLLLLGLAAANVAGLSLTQALSRQAAGGVKRALGAGRGRLVREIVTEHVALGLAGAAMAIAFTSAASGSLSRIRLDAEGAALTGLTIPATLPVMAIALALATAVLAAVGPIALTMPGRWPPQAVGVEGRVTRRLRAVLAAAQVGLSIVLLVGAGLMARTVIGLQSLALGFDPDGVLAFNLDPSRLDLGEAEVSQLLTRLSEALEADPAIAAAGMAFPEPLRPSYLTAALRAPSGSPGSELIGAHLQVTRGFLEALGVDMLAGRGFLASEQTNAEGEGVVIVTASAARLLFPERGPTAVIGEVVFGPGAEGRPLRLVGVVADFRVAGPRGDPPPVFVRPWAQGGFDDVATAWVRARPGAYGRLAEVVRRVTRETAPALPIFDLRSVEAQADRLIAEVRVITGLATTTSLLGLLLAGLGLYGVLAYAVATGQHELGVRAALGASRRSLVRRFVWRGLRIALLGLVPGVIGALFFTGVLESRLYGVGRLDPLTWAGGLAVLACVSVLASWLPARRAARVDIVRVLAAE